MPTKAKKPDKPKPQARPCAVEGCPNEEGISWVRCDQRYVSRRTGRVAKWTSWYWKRWVRCHAHMKRRVRFGLYTARQCAECGTVVDSKHDETERLYEPNEKWLCNSCLGKREDAA